MASVVGRGARLAVRLAVRGSSRRWRGPTRALASTSPGQRPLVSSLHHPRLLLQQHRRQLHVSGAAQKIISYELADIGEGIVEAEVIEWHVAVGDTVKQFDQLCDVNSDKATTDISSRYDGKIVKIHYAVNEMAQVGKPLVDIEVEDDGSEKVAAGLPVPNEAPLQEVELRAADTSAPTSAPEATAAASPATAPTATKFLMTPAVRRIVREHGIDLNSVTATGKEGRFLKEDVLGYLEAKGLSDSLPSAAKPAPQQQQQRVEAAVAEDVVIPVTGITKMMVKSMTAALQVPHFGYCDEIELDRLMATRQSLRAALAELDPSVRLSFMPFFIKAASIALKDFPLLNAHVNADCTAITQKAAHNIGLAMDTPNGLVVPNIKNVEAKSIVDIATELSRLQELGGRSALKSSDLTGGTFTLSNIGVVGGTYASPVVAVPEVAIGAIGKISRVPRFDEHDNVVPVNIMQVSWSADHRVVDGVTMARFSNRWKALLERPDLMLMGLK